MTKARKRLKDKNIRKEDYGKAYGDQVLLEILDVLVEILEVLEK